MAKRGTIPLRQAFGRLELSKKNKDVYIPAILGFMINGEETVEVNGRASYVYARIRSNINEVVQVFNDKVSPVYDLPVLLIRDPSNPSRYTIDKRDTGRYEVWGDASPYLPVHGNQHSFNPETGGGGDITFVYDRQIVPLSIIPSGSAGSGNILIGKDIVYRYGMWQVLGGTGTVSLLPAKPTDNTARMMLIGLGIEGNPWVVSGTTFDGTITGTSAITPYLPSPSSGTVLGAIRLVSGTISLTWDNVYDLRSFVT